MNKEEMIEKEVEKTMELFENIGQIEPDPYFYNKLNNKLVKNKKKNFFNSFPIFTEFSLKPVLLLFLIIVNVITALYFLSDNGKKIELKKDINYYSKIFQSEYSIYQNNYVNNITNNISSGEK